MEDMLTQITKNKMSKTLKQLKEAVNSKYDLPVYITHASGAGKGGTYRKIDIHGADGKYLTSTNAHPNVKSAVDGYMKDHPHIGMVKGYYAESISEDVTKDKQEYSRTGKFDKDLEENHRLHFGHNHGYFFITHETSGKNGHFGNSSTSFDASVEPYMISNVAKANDINPSDFQHLKKMHLRDIHTGEPLHAVANAYYHAGIDKYQSKNVNHLASHLGIPLEHADDIIRRVDKTPDIEDKKAIVNNHIDSLRPEWKHDAEKTHEIIDRLGNKVSESLKESPEYVRHHIEVKLFGNKNKWKRLSVTKKVPFTEKDLSDYAYQYGLDNQINPNRISARSIDSNGKVHTVHNEE